MKIGKAKPKGVAGVTPARKAGDPERPPGWAGTGRPTLYRPEYCQSVVEFFKRESWQIIYDAKGSPKVMPKDSIPTFERWCAEIGVASRTLDDWRAKYPEFQTAYEKARDAQFAFLIESGLANGSGGFAMFMLRCNHGMKEPKQESPTENLAEQLATLIGKMPS